MATTIRARRAQSLFDIALQTHGHVEGIYDVMKRNNLYGPVDHAFSGMELKVSSKPMLARTHTFLKAHALATLENEARAQGIGWWVIERDFIVQKDPLNVQ